MDSVFISSVDIPLVSGNGHFHFIRVLDSDNSPEVTTDFIVTFRTPRDIMDVRELEQMNVVKP